MKVFVGLGNPGDKYKGSRHNYGFALLDELSRKLEINFYYINKFEAEVAEKEINGQKIFLFKAQTFMNNSGKALIKFIDFYKIENKDITVIYDDLDLEIGTFRVTGKSSAGHRGMESVIETLKSAELVRYRMGINNANRDELPADVFVLEAFTSEEIPNKEKVINQITNKILASLAG